MVNPNEQTFAEKLKTLDWEEQELLFTPEAADRPNSERETTPNKLLKMEKEWTESFKELLEKQTLRNEGLHEENENLRMQ